MRNGRAEHLRTRYGLTEEQFDEMLEEQGGVCRLCFSLDRLHVDHDHSCCPGRKSCGSCIRGLICKSCNVALGLFEDDVARMRRAIDYLSRPQSNRG